MSIRNVKQWCYKTSDPVPLPEPWHKRLSSHPPMSFVFFEIKTSKVKPLFSQCPCYLEALDQLSSGQCDIGQSLSSRFRECWRSLIFPLDLENIHTSWNYGSYFTIRSNIHAIERSNQEQNQKQLKLQIRREKELWLLMTSAIKGMNSVTYPGTYQLMDKENVEEKKVLTIFMQPIALGRISASLGQWYEQHLRTIAPT